MEQIFSATDSSNVYAVFSSTNDPRSTNSAVMAAGTMGQIDLSGTSTPHNVNAKITWEAEKCVVTPLLVAVEQYSSGGGLGFYAVNGGNPF
ncbi:hypothetical protein KIH87_16000 [Paraneptunicella aestuarii]|uniref:hypothetical protein n=1 Tax=Paraneptunicella aestuarii TaxID=2831148 RepID=UPI001E4FCAC5|nr:hypothetical protein [Paraneptunicella aestuarii]UAA38175.1 hypothetical protein KIH87_16000 [Paraneptunicella aestuarii]